MLKQYTSRMQNSCAYTYLAQFYDQLIGVDYHKWVTYLEQTWQKFDISPQEILELACGTGGITIPLAQKGYRLTAVDRSAAMLAQAHKKAAASKVEVTFINHTMEDIRIKNLFDVVICCCDALNYVTQKDDLLLFFRNAYRHTKHGGILLFDLNSEKKLRELYGNQTYAETFEDYAYYWQNHFDEEQKICQMDLTFFIKSDTESYYRVSEQHFEKLWQPQEIYTSLRACGWKVVGYYGFMSWEQPEDEEERWQFAAIKN